MSSFQKKLIGFQALFVSLIIIVLCFINYQSFKSESTVLTQKILLSSNSSMQDSLSATAARVSSQLEAINLDSLHDDFDALPSDVILQLQLMRESQKEISGGIFLFTKDGDIYDSNGDPLPINVKQLKRDYYTSMFVDNDSFAVTPPYMSTSSGLVVSLAVKLTDSIAIISNLTVKALIGDNNVRNDLFIYNDDGIIIFSPNKEMDGKNIFEERPEYRQFNQTNASITYDMNIDGKKQSFMALWGSLPDLNLNYVSFSDVDEVYAAVQDQLLNSVGVAVIALGSLFVFLYLFSEKMIMKPIGGDPSQVEGVVANLASGDLTANSRNVTNESGIYYSVLKLTSKLSEVMASSSNISNQVAASSEELMIVMQNTAKNTQSELAQVEEISTAISELSSTSKEVSINAVQAEDETRRALDNVSKGNKALEESITLTNTINASVQDVANLIEDLKNSAIDIGEVTHVINSISEQTNLLALNAAIEAARAGEHGRGFAVVADEVRVLASRTQESTKSIQTIIMSLQEKSENANNNMASNVTSIQKSVELSESVKTSFDDIAHSVQMISDINALVATASQEQYSVTEDIAKNTTRTFDLVNENVAAVNQTQEAVKELAVLAERQNQELSFFKLDR